MFRVLLVLLSLMLVAQTSSAQLLDEPDVTAVDGQAEVRINFSTPITYLRHFPTDIGDTLRIFIDVSDPCAVESIRNQESKNYPANGLVNPFVITFPEIIDNTSNGSGTCQASGKKGINTTKTLLVKFDTWTPYKVRLGDDNHSIILTVAIRAGAVVKFEQPKLKVPMPPAQAGHEKLLKSAKAAISEGEYDSAIEMLNRLLNMPPNKSSQEAQEQIGMARELNRDLTKAKVEYELYLKLYPNSEGAKRVSTRLAGIESGKPTVIATKKTKKTYVQKSEVTTFGSVSQYYYGSRSTTHNSGALNSTQKITEQSALVNTIDLTTRWRHNQYDDKIVIRDALTNNFTNDTADANRLTAAYWDHEDKDLGFMTRLGRQPGNSQGILGRFDGVFGRYTINNTWKVTGALGVPDNGVHSAIKTNRYFYGSAVEFAAPGSSFSGNVYAIQQLADSIEERRAVGSELRYFKDKLSMFGLVDYDTLYKEVNIALLQGNWTGFGDINFNGLIDHRKTPILNAETGLRTSNPASDSVSELKKLFSRSQIYDNVNRISPITDTALIGATKQINLQWQVGGDARVTRTSATSSYFDNLGNLVAGNPGTGSSYTYSVQAIGSNTFFKDDTSVITASYIDDPTFQGQTFGITNIASFRTKYKVDSSVNFFHSRTNSSAPTVKVTPAVRFAYQWKDNVMFEAQFGLEKTWQDDRVALLSTKSDSLREFMFIGYRWDY